MQTKLDMRVAELLASKLCHDLVGPVSAINNGMELLGDEDMGMDKEAMDLVAGSAQQASAVLQFFRLAYGQAGEQMNDLAEVRRLTQDLLAHSRVTLDWPAQMPGMIPEGLAKLLLNLLYLASEALPRGGRLELSMTNGAEGFQVSVTAVGQDAALRPEVMDALDPEVEPTDLTPRAVHAHFSQLVASRRSGRVTVRPEAPDRLVVAALLPG